MATPTPFTGLVTLRKEMDRLFDRFWEGDWKELPMMMGQWVPPLDMTESKDAVTIRMDVPGLEPKDLSLTLQESQITVRGEKKSEREEKTETCYRAERQHGQFTRVIRLPSSVNPDKVTATFKNGVLTISLLKLPEAKGTEIPIKAV